MDYRAYIDIAEKFLYKDDFKNSILYYKKALLCKVNCSISKKSINELILECETKLKNNEHK